MSETQQLLQAIDEQQSSLLDILRKLVAFKTVSPPARNTNDIQAFVGQQLEQDGFAVKKQAFYNDDALVSGRLPGSAPDQYHSLLLNGHVDVAALTDLDKWQTDPFELIRHGDDLFGRGVSDMKGAVACFLYLFKLLRQLNIQLPGDLLFQSVVGEEAGEAGTKTLLEQGETADFAVVGDTSNMAFQGQGGVVTGWITLKSPHTYHDGNRVNMVSAGGGLKAASMVEKMPVVIEALQKLEHFWAVTKQYPGFPAGTNTINPAYIEGGIHPAFVANECKLWITVHFYPDETIDQVTHEIETAVVAATKADPWLKDILPIFNWGGESMLVDKGEVFPALAIDQSSPAIHLLSKSHQQQLGEQPLINMSTSVTDGGWFDFYHIPAVTYGPGRMEQAHSDNETAQLSQLLDYTKILADFVLKWCSQSK
ncbi:acetylornithine deacetylase [Lactobacillus sp. LC28-10]|uniref:Probable succinyl-diaminopimelate desuccinylase n=1 Tax=Secundilactobacillus angelensis TaxID=2722706 RepID=A0ABX1L012_9LACO|nr:acetylornithine deacetylase [Secundilactobacillus angelensis]MCH5463178.1 acetylornithine deacetylase [Secundilactobacillus angelensis]NLR19529.1 acetylornithine deacetylase [Secundilactobacillus angelensis]